MRIDIARLSARDTAARIVGAGSAMPGAGA